MLNKIFFSLGITSLVSVLFALIFATKFWYVFALAFLLQILFFYFLNTVYENSLIEKAQKIKIQQYIEENRQVATVQCPCDQKNMQDVDMRFDQDITYRCNNCNKNIKANVDVKTVLITEPIYFNDRA